MQTHAHWINDETVHADITDAFRGACLTRKSTISSRFINRNTKNGTVDHSE